MSKSSTRQRIKCLEIWLKSKNLPPKRKFKKEDDN